MKRSQADIQNAELQARDAAAQVDTQVDDILRLRRTKQPTGTAKAALEMMVAFRDDALERLKLMRRALSDAWHQFPVSGPAASAVMSNDFMVSNSLRRSSTETEIAVRFPLGAV